MKKKNRPDILPSAEEFRKFLTNQCGVTRITPGKITGDPKGNKTKRISVKYLGNGNFEIEFRHKEEQPFAITTSLRENDFREKIRRFCTRSDFALLDKDKK